MLAVSKPPCRGGTCDRVETDCLCVRGKWPRVNLKADFEEIDLVGAQELANILKQGYLEKKRREKQQKGAFYINGYQVELVGSLRKDAKKNACFELKAPGQRTYQFTANTAKEAKEWVDQINFVLKDISSTQIPYDDGEEDMEESQISQGNEDQEEETYDDIDAAISPNTAHNSFSSQSVDGPFEDEEDNDIYEELPDEEFPLATSGEGCGNKLPSGESSVDYANYYQGMWDCTGDQSDELSFKRGDLIYILSKCESKMEYSEKSYRVNISPLA
ncbi:SKAP1 protein, partial [Polypterus senegalus]|nr:SKAP1 protein [Polypterus senegalus]